MPRTNVIMFFTGAEVYRRDNTSFPEQLVSAPLTLSRLRDGSARLVRVARAPSGIATELCGPGWVSVGDSASCYDPLSGRGVYKALCHAEAASKAVDAWLRGACDPSHTTEDEMSYYVAKVRHDYELYPHQRNRFYLSENRWADHPFWRARRESVRKPTSNRPDHQGK